MLSVSSRAWSVARDFLGSVGFEPTCVQDLFEISRTHLQSAITLCSAELSDGGSLRAYEMAISEAHVLEAKKTDWASSPQLLLLLFPACLEFAACRAELAEGRDLDAVVRAEFALHTHRTSVRTAKESFSRLGFESSLNNWGDFADPRTSRSETTDEDWWWFLPLDNPVASMNREALRLVAESRSFANPAEAAAFLRLVALELSEVAIICDSAGSLNPFELATAYNPGAPWDFHALSGWSSVWQLPRHAEAFESVASFRFVDALPPSAPVGVLTAEHLLADGVTSACSKLLTHLDASNFTFGTEEELWEHRLKVATLAAMVARREGDPDSAHGLLTSAMDAVPPSLLAFSGSERLTDAYSEAQRSIAYLEGWRDARADSISGSEIREELAKLQRIALSSRTREIQHGDILAILSGRLEKVDGNLEAQSGLMLELPDVLNSQLRDAISGESDSLVRRVTEEVVSRQWDEIADKLIRKGAPSAAIDRLSQRFGSDYERLTMVARDYLVAFEILMDQYEPALASLAVTGLAGILEAQLKAALLRNDVPIEGEPGLGALLASAASQPSGPLQVVGVRARDSGLLDLRNKAAHAAATVGDADFQRLKQVFLGKADGLIWKLVS